MSNSELKTGWGIGGLLRVAESHMHTHLHVEHACAETCCRISRYMPVSPRCPYMHPFPPTSELTFTQEHSHSRLHMHASWVFA